MTKSAMPDFIKNQLSESWPYYLAGSATLGAGTFAIGQLFQEIKRMNRLAKLEKQRGSLPENALIVDIPQEKEKLPDTVVKQARVLDSTLATLVGAPAGFLATKAIYDNIRKNQLKEDIERENAKYMAVMSELTKHSQEATPHVDAFCLKIAESIEKTAAPINWAAIVAALKNAAGKSKDLAVSGWGKSKEYYNTAADFWSKNPSFDKYVKSPSTKTVNFIKPRAVPAAIAGSIGYGAYKLWPDPENIVSKTIINTANNAADQISRVDLRPSITYAKNVAVGTVNNMVDSMKQTANNAADVVKQTAETAKNNFNESKDTAFNIWKTLTALTALGTAGAMINAARKKEEKSNTRDKIPANVGINTVNLPPHIHHEEATLPIVV